MYTDTDTSKRVDAKPRREPVQRALDPNHCISTLNQLTLSRDGNQFNVFVRRTKATMMRSFDHISNMLNKVNPKA
jgi:hypothetical protein